MTEPLASLPPPARRAAFMAAVLAATAAAYAPSLPGSFTFDDLPAISQRAELADLGRIAWSVPGSLVGLSRGVTDLTFALDLAVHGQDPGPFRAENVAIHLGLALVLAFAGEALLRRAGVVQGWIAWVAAGLWALHPLGSGAVAYVAQRYEGLSSLFLGGAFLLALQAEEGRRPGPRRAAAFALVLLGFGAKGLTVSAFAVLGLALLVAPPGAPRVDWRGLAGRVAPWLAAAVAFAAGTLWRLQGKTGAGFDMVDVAPAEYWAAQGRVILAYARLVVLPVGQSADPDFPAGRGLDLPSLAAWAVVALAGAGCVAALARRPAGANPLPRVAAFGGAWFLALLLPTSALPIADLMAEHRAYLASWGLVLAATSLAALALQAWVPRPGTRAAAGAVLALVAMGALGSALAVRARLWGDAVALWTDAAEKAPDYYRPRGSLADALRRAGDKEGAAREWRNAARLWPEAAVAASLRDLAVVEAMGAAGQREEALRLVEQIRLRVMPTPRVLLPLALVQLHLGAPRDAALTMSFAFFLSGPSPEAMQVQAQIHLAEGQVEQAVAAAAAADELAGGSAASRTFLARLLYSVGRRAEACEVLTAAGPARAELGATARTFGCSR